MSIRAGYPSIFPHVETIKPFIALEFFMADVKIEPEIKPVTTLIRQIFGEEVSHPEFPTSSIAVIETAAEKWVGLTRRVATSRHRQHYHNVNLVRHLYDLYKINEAGYITAHFNQLVSRIVMDDRKRYMTHNNDYYHSPISEIERAIDELQRSSEWHDHWDKFVDTMVFASTTPNYDQALSNLLLHTEAALKALREVDFSDC